LHQRDSTGEVVSVVISQAAATSFIHMLRFAANQVSQSILKTGSAARPTSMEPGGGVQSSGSCMAQAVLRRAVLVAARADTEFSLVGLSRIAECHRPSASAWNELVDIRIGRDAQFIGRPLPTTITIGNQVDKIGAVSASPAS